MDDQKTKQHLKKQRRLKRNLIRSIVLPLLITLVFSTPFLLIGIKFLRTEPLAPIEVTFAECRWEGLKYRRLELYTRERNAWMIARSLRNDFYQDVENGIVRPGDRLTVTCYSRILEDGVVIIATGDKVYGDLEVWRANQKSDACGFIVIFAFFFSCGLAISCIMYIGSRREFSKIRKLTRKYKARQREGYN